MTALETARAMGADVPDRVDIVAVEARVGLDFTETLSPAVAAAVRSRVRRGSEAASDLGPAPAMSRLRH